MFHDHNLETRYVLILLSEPENIFILYKHRRQQQQPVVLKNRNWKSEQSPLESAPTAVTCGRQRSLVSAAYYHHHRMVLRSAQLCTYICFIYMYIIIMSAHSGIIDNHLMYENFHTLHLVWNIFYVKFSSPNFLSVLTLGRTTWGRVVLS